MKKRWWEINSLANTPNTAEIKIYGEITSFPWYEGEVSANSFEKALAEYKDADKLVVRINSPGGDTFEAQAIYNALKNHSAEIEVRIDALAASAATIIACAGDSIIMPDNALYMIHNPWSWASGEAKDMRKKADLLDTVKDTVISVYSKKSGESSEEIARLMDEETWLTASEALEKGFITDMAGEGMVDSSVNNAFQFLNNSKLPYGIPKNVFKNFKPLSSDKEKIKDENPQEVVMTKEEFIKNHADIHEEIRNTAATEAKKLAITEERERVANLSNLKNIPGASDIVEDAIKNGLSVAECSMNIANSDAVKNMGAARTEKAAIKEDMKSSGADEVVPTPSPSAEEKKQEEIKNQADEMTEMFRSKGGR